jgi:hypothetical protein
MLKITRTTTQQGTAIRLDGRLAGAWVEELRRTLSAETRNVTLDCIGLAFADAEGTDLLRDVVRRGVELTRCAGFLLLQIAEDQPSTAKSQRGEQ